MTACTQQSMMHHVETRQERIGVLQLIDSLWQGGAEHVAVNLANWLPRGRYRSYLCTTRCDGPLRSLLASDVQHLGLARRISLDVSALRRLVQFIRHNNVHILHAHSSTLLTANLASRFAPYPKVIWHVHWGGYATRGRSPWIERQLARRACAVIAVSHLLADWSRRGLGLPDDRVSYIPNAVVAPTTSHSVPVLPGTPGARIVCVANLRPEKDHLNLVNAIALTRKQIPDVHLLLVGVKADPEYVARVERTIQEQSLQQHVTLLGGRDDVSSILQQVDVGVLCSLFEGLPLTLLEYGMAGLGVVATRVGQCEDVLDDGRCGVLVPPREPAALAEALVGLLKHAAYRQAMGERLRQHVQANFSVDATIQKIDRVYEQALAETHS